MKGLILIKSCQDFLTITNFKGQIQQNSQVIKPLIPQIYLNYFFAHL